MFFVEQSIFEKTLLFRLQSKQISIQWYYNDQMLYYHFSLQFILQTYQQMSNIKVSCPPKSSTIIKSCSYYSAKKLKSLIQFILTKNSQNFTQISCQNINISFNWICLECQKLICQKQVKKHLINYHKNEKHVIIFKLPDFLFWCYTCQCQINSSELKQAKVHLNQLISTKIKITQHIEEQNKLNYQILLDNLKNNKYKRIVVLTGAGLSVASGIPDLRSPKTGLCSQLDKYNLPYIQSIFQLKFYMENPEPFMRVSKQYFSNEYHPTIGHKFIKKLEQKGMLYKNLTQNIDDLQTKAGISPDKLLQVHGHARSVHCTACSKEASIEEWKLQLQKLEPMNCKSCGSLIKPDIVFFGEQLPKQFYEALQIIEKADLVFIVIVGTTLAVVPFSCLGSMIKKDCPLVLVNNEDSIAYRQDKLWLKGDIQQTFYKLMKQINWL